MLVDPRDQGVFRFFFFEDERMVDESTSRSEWKLGRVMDVASTGPHVRKVNVRRADDKVVLKDRTKVVKLELDE